VLNGGLRLRRGSLLQRRAELAHGLSQRTRQRGQPFGTKHDQRDRGDEDQVNRVLDAHAVSRLAPWAARAITSERTPTLCLVSAQGIGPGGRAYPPPRAGEPLWPAQATLLAAIGLQLLLPDRLTVGPTWLIPALEGALLVGLFLASPGRLERDHPRRRSVAIGFIALVSAANVFSLAELTHHLLHAKEPTNGRELIISGMLIWLTNFLIFALWYWEIDRGGPGKRAAGHDTAPDFLFPQMNDDRIEPVHWRPQFIDYLYVSLTNATAFSPTDTMPLSPMAKAVMGVQSLVSLVTLGLIISRAVNVL
jgi:uncharacterized membrane protein